MCEVWCRSVSRVEDPHIWESANRRDSARRAKTRCGRFSSALSIRCTVDRGAGPLNSRHRRREDALRSAVMAEELTVMSNWTVSRLADLLEASADLKELELTGPVPMFCRDALWVRRPCYS